MTLTFAQGKPLHGYSRGKTPITQIVIHESVTSSRESTINVLAPQGYGVHIIVDRDGSVTQHVPFAKAAIHAEGFGKPSLHNETSIAVEVVNRYYGAHASQGETVIDAPWAHKGKYIVPTDEQLEAVWTTIQAICAEFSIPVVFPGVKADGALHFVWGRIPVHEVPGVMAHHRWAHSDGLYPEHYCWLRFLGHPPAMASGLTRAAAL